MFVRPSALFLVGLMLGSIGSIGCGASMQAIGQPVGRNVQSGSTEASAVTGSVRQALSRLRYQINQNGENYTIATYTRGSRQFTVRVDHDATSYRIGLVQSVGYNQGTDPATGQPVISSRYHRYVSKLDRLIVRYLTRGGGAASEEAVESDGGPERSIALAQPIAMATIERALVISGIDVETRRDDAGFVTTQFRDTGVEYSQVDGDDATFHQRFTIVLSANEVRIRMDLKLCATGGLVVTSSMGAASLTGRCEAAELPANRGLRRHVRGQLMTAIDQIERELTREIEASAPQQPTPMQPAQPAPAQPGSDEPTPMTQPVFTTT